MDHPILLLLVFAVAAAALLRSVPLRQYELGRRRDTGEIFSLTDDDLNCHAVLMGAVGSGKSRLLWQLLREHRRNRRGFCLIDPGDLWADFIADMALEVLQGGDTRLFKKLHLVQLSPFMMARYDALRFHYPKAVHPELRDVMYEAWQHTKALSLATAFNRRQGRYSFEGTPRLERVSTNVFTAVTTLVDGKRLSVGEAEVLLDLGHPDHERFYERLRDSGKLRREVQADFETLHGFRRLQDVRLETESTLNMLRAVIGGPLMRQCLGSPDEPSLDLFGIQQRGDYLIVNVQETPFASRDQNVALAGMMIHDWVETAVTTPRELRRESTLIIDEGHEYAGPDIGRYMRIGRKYLGIVIGTQDVASLKKDDVDLSPSILGIPETLIALRMKWPDDLETVVRLLRTGDIDHSALAQEIYQHQGDYNVVKLRSVSEGLTAQKSWSHAAGQSLTNSTSQTQTESHSTQTNHSAGHSWSNTSGTSITGGRSASHDRDLHGTITGKRDADQSSRGLSESAGQGGNVVAGTGEGKSHGTAHGSSMAVGNTVTDTQGASEGYSRSESLTEHLVPILVRVMQPTGSLKVSEPDQISRFKQELAGQGQREATVKHRGDNKSVPIEVMEVADPFVSPDAQMKAVDWVIRELAAAHDYYFVPEPQNPNAGGVPVAYADEPLLIDHERNAERSGDGDAKTPFDN